MMFVTIDPPDDAVTAMRETVVAPSTTSNRIRSSVREMPVDPGAGWISVTCGVGTGAGVHCEAIGCGFEADLACGISPEDGAPLLALHATSAQSASVATEIILEIGVISNAVTGLKKPPLL
jgi:hypothetical protein